MKNPTTPCCRKPAIISLLRAFPSLAKAIRKSPPMPLYSKAMSRTLPKVLLRIMQPPWLRSWPTPTMASSKKAP